MPGPRPHRCPTLVHSLRPRSRAARVGRAVLALAAATVAGCSASLPEPDSDSAYTGPALTLESAGPRHILVISAPSPGWRATLDRVTERHRLTDAFVTLTPPDGRFLVAESPTRQHLALPIESRHAVRVCARVAAADAPAEGDYPVVAQSAGQPPK